MGQTIGRAPLLPGPRHFANLPKANIYNMWSTFQSSAEGFGLTQDEFLGILRACLSDYLEYSAKKLDQIGKAVFTTLDDDANDLIDALEFMAAFGIMSGMTLTEKARFVFGVFDLDEAGVLSGPEVAFALRTTISGLCKLSAVDPPLESEIEHVASKSLPGREKGGPLPPAYVTLEGWVTFCEATPELVSWLQYYGDNDETGVPKMGPDELDEQCALLVTHGGRTLYRSGAQFGGMDLDLGGGARAGVEARGKAKDVSPQLPWQTTVVPFTEPTDCPPVLPDSAPDAHLKVERVHGFNSKCGRQTVCYSGRGEVVYPAGSLGVVYDLDSDVQRFMSAHTDMVLCLRVHIIRPAASSSSAGSSSSSSPPSSPLSGGGSVDGDQEREAAASAAEANAATTLVCSGEAGRVPKVLVWSTGSRSESPKVLACLVGFHKDGVAHVAWSPDGEKVATVGASGYHCVAVYAWRTNTLLFTGPASEQPVLDCCFQSCDRFVTCGVNHVHFWTQDKDRATKIAEGILVGSKGPKRRPVNVPAANAGKGGVGGGGGGGVAGGEAAQRAVYVRERGLFGKKAAVMPLLCCKPFGPSLVLTGGGSGHLVVWEGRNCIRSAKAHSGAITALFVIPARSLEAKRHGHSGGLISASTDGKLQLWNNQLEFGRQLDTMQLCSPMSPLVQSVTWDEPNHKVLVAFWSAEVHEVHDSEGYDLHDGPLLTGHHAHRVFGLAVSPNDPSRVATCGEDRTVRVWDVHSYRVVAAAVLDTMCHCLDWSCKGMLAVGLGYQGDPSPGFGPGARRQRKDGGFIILRGANAIGGGGGDGSGSPNSVGGGGSLNDGLASVASSGGASLGDRSSGSIRGSVTSGGGGGGASTNSPGRRRAEDRRSAQAALSVVHEGRDAQQLVSTIRFSPDGNTLACGSFDRTLYLYARDKSMGGWAPLAKCQGHRGRVTHIDFGVGNKLLQSCDDAGYLMFWEASGARAGDEVKKNNDPDGLWSTVKDTKWSTHSSVFGWSVQGCWGSYDDGCKVTCASRSYDENGGGGGGSGGGQQSTKVLATTDAFSRVRLYRWPCALESPNFAEYTGHGGGGASACAFSVDDAFLFTVGEEDCCLIQWRFDSTGGAPSDEACTEDLLVGPSTLDLKDGRDYERFPEAEAANIDDRTKIFFMEERAADADFAPVRPWQRNAIPPSRPPPERLDEPLSSLRLCWMYGFRAMDCRQQVKYLKPWGLHPDQAATVARSRGSGGDESLVGFFGGCVTAVLESVGMTQTFHRDHTDEVMSMSVHPTRSLCATAQQGKTPSIMVWDYRGDLRPKGAPPPPPAPGTAGGAGGEGGGGGGGGGGGLEAPRPTKATLIALHGSHRRGVSHLSFSHDGKYLASLGEDDWHSLCVHDWENAAVVCLRTTVKETSFDLQFAPPAPRPPLASPVPAPMELVQCGVNFLRFWTVEGHNASWQSASLGSEGQWQTFLCLGFVGVEPWQASVDSGDNRAFAANVVAKPKVNGRRTVVGCQDGALYLLAGIHLSKTIPAHTGPVNVVSCSSGAVASGGADGLVKVWRYVDRTGTLEIKTVIDIATQGSVAPVIRSLDFDPGPNKLLVGTLGAELFELSSLDGTNCSVGGGPLLQGHAHPDEDAEVHGFSAHPTSARFVTTGDDATLRIWDADQRSVVAMTALEAPSRCVAYNPKGTLLAVGFGSAFKKKAKQVDGKFVIMSVGDFSVVYEGQTAGNKYLTECKWSPDGSILVFGCADNRIYIYNADDGYALKASAVSHDFPIRSIDFSKNSTFLLSNCSGYGLNFFEADTGSAISDLAKVKDQKWATCSSPMQWSSMGAWPPQNDGTDVTTCDAVGGVLATGDSFGRLRLFRHPCDSALAQGKLYRAHGSSTPNPMSARGNPPRAAPQITPTLAGEGWGGLSKVRWVGKGRYLVSVAAREKVLFQWVHDVDEAGKADDLDCLPMPMSANLKAEVLGPDASEGPVAVAEENLEGLAAAGAQARAAETAADEEAFGGGAAAAAAAAKKKKKSKGGGGGGGEGGEDGGGGAGGDQVGGGSSSSTAKPWLSSMVQPSDPSVFGDPSAPPDLKGLSLERVLGVSSTARGSKQANLGYNSLGECVWCAASVVVVYNKKAHQQRLFRGHHGAEATCVSVSPCGRFVASGERGDRPLVRVWDAATCVEIASLGPFHRRGVACLAWSRDAKTVVSVGADLEHSVAVWGSASGLWEDAKKVVEDGSCKGQTARNQASKLAYACGDHQPVYFACFLDPLCWGPGGLYNQPDLAANAVAAANGVKLPPKHPGYLFATGGVDHVKLWSLEGRTLTCERGLWGAGAKVQPMLCGCAAGARLVTGAASGHLYAWRGRLCEKLVKAHDGPVATCWAVTYADGVGGCVVSGGAHDGCVRLFNEKLEPLSTHDVSASAQVPPLLSGIRGVCGGLAEGGGIAQGASPGGTGEFVNRVLLSTTSAEVYELSTQSGSFTLLAEGHYSGDPATEGAFGEAWGLSPHPTKSDLCATCGDDGSVRVWSIANQGRLLRKCLLDSTARCVSWSPDGTKLVVGLGGSAVPGAGRRSKDGCFVVLDADTLEVLHEARDAKHWLRDAKFTPGGESFALCSQDGTVYLYDTRALSLRAKCDNLTGPATRCDFSEDGAYIQVDGGRDTNKHGPGLGFEHMYFGAGNGAAFELPSQLKNVKWGTWTCRLGWPVQAVWPKLEEDVSGGEAESVEPTSCDRNGAKDLVASGYQDGRVQVFRYPSLVKGTHSATVVGHAGAVGLVRFSCDGKFLLSLGQKDRCLLVWRVWRKSEKITGSSLVLSSLVRSPDDGLPPLKLPPPPNPTAAQVAYSMVGAMVEVHGLTTLRPELNGCVGVVTHVLSNQSGGDALAKFVVKLTARPGGGRISKKDRGGLVLRPENTRKIVKIKKDTDGGVVLKN